MLSTKAAKEIRREVRSWQFHLRSHKSLEELSRIANPVLRGWINYYGQYHKSALYRSFHVFYRILMSLAMRKYKKSKDKTRNVVGTGLGLPIVKSIVEAHNGTIKAESKEGAWCALSVRLPVR